MAVSTIVHPLQVVVAGLVGRNWLGLVAIRMR